MKSKLKFIAICFLFFIFRSLAPSQGKPLERLSTVFIDTYLEVLLNERRNLCTSMSGKLSSSFNFIIDFNVENNDELQGLTKFI